MSFSKNLGNWSATFLFSRWNFGYQGAFSQTFLSHDRILAIKEPFHKFLFHMMEFRLRRSLFTDFSLTRWNFGYHGDLSRISLSHDGISAMMEPFHGFLFNTMEFRLSRSPFTNFSFTRWNFGYHGAFREFLFHTMEFWLSRSLSQNSQNSRIGGRHIYHKEYLHRIHHVKNLASWFRAPFARKRVRSFLL
jgi:hypothetical protein